ncbi:MAG: TRAP transporter large permease subunit [Alphaproteobacteria bacterium]|nr:TRAP transporter large permease subunit [Alphaproteobacteria bacterium]
MFAVAGFSAVSGASSAAAAVFAKVAIPEMLQAKYDKRLAAGVCAAGATLDSLIPPSTLLVVYGIITEQSIGRLLVAGFVPGIFSAFVYAVIITWRCWRQPELGPRIRGYTWPQRVQSLPGTTPIFLVILDHFPQHVFPGARPRPKPARRAPSGARLRAEGRYQARRVAPVPAILPKLTVMIFTVIRGVLIFVRFWAFGMPEEVSCWVTDLAPPPLKDPAGDSSAVLRPRHLSSKASACSR